MEVCVYHALDSINEINRKMPDVNLRDLFAMNALQGMLSTSYYGDPAKHQDITELAYAIADEMIKARKRK